MACHAQMPLAVSPSELRCMVLIAAYKAVFLYNVRISINGSSLK